MAAGIVKAAQALRCRRLTGNICRAAAFWLTMYGTFFIIELLRNYYDDM